MSGFIILQNGGHEAEVHDTDECAKEILSIWNWCEDLGMEDIAYDTPIFNENQGCVNWWKNVCTKGMCHINLNMSALLARVWLMGTSPPFMLMGNSTQLIFLLLNSMMAPISVSCMTLL